MRHFHRRTQITADPTKYHLFFKTQSIHMIDIARAKLFYQKLVSSIAMGVDNLPGFVFIVRSY